MFGGGELADRRRPKFCQDNRVEFMALILGAVLAVFSIAIVAYPLLKSRLQARSEDGRLNARWPTDLENLYDAIRTLQLEYQLGQLPETLYREHLRDYRIQAAATLRQQTKDQTGPPAWLVEQEVLIARAARGVTNGGPRPCPSCRSLPAAGMRVCPECGTELGAPLQGP